MELQNFGEILAQIFPERVKKLSNSNYSKIWGMNVKKLLIRLKKGSYLTNKSLIKLKEGLILHFGKRAQKCFELLNKLENQDSDQITLIDEIRKEIGRISNLIKIEDTELSFLFFNNVNYLKSLKQWLTNPKNPQYNPNFKLSLEQLEDIKTVLKQLLADDANFCISLIDEYISNNPDLREYSYQQFTITNPHFFDIIDTIENDFEKFFSKLH